MSTSASTNPPPLGPMLFAIHSPDDVKALPEEDLALLADEVRRTLITTLARTGGHLGPNLGVVELSIALHRVFSTPRDKLVFDVSHQGYIHKMLTGRAARIHTLRSHRGLNGFLLRSESPHDAYGAGHAGTALSAALGMAAARDLAGEDFHVVAVAGDAAFTCGPTMEALNNVAQSTRRLIVVLNDNEWSIDRNVGAIAGYFNTLRTNPTYHSARKRTAELVERVAGKTARHFVHRMGESAKNLLLPNVLFERFGMRYYGPLDGHDMPLLIRTFEHIRGLDEPVVLHVITEKGRGYQPALDDPCKFHGLGSYKLEDGSTASNGPPSCSEIFGRTLTDLAHKDRKIIAITAAMPAGTRLDLFKEEIPERFHDVGIAEEHAALFAAGMAAQGCKPFLAIYSTFMQRAYDMIIHDLALQNLPVRLCMDRGGLSGDDGPTHHGLFDISFLRAVPGLVHMQPRDEDELVDMLHTMAAHDGGPIAIRYPRGAITGSRKRSSGRCLEIGRAEVVADGSDVALLGLGTMFGLAEEVRTLLAARGLSAALVNPRFIKPLDGAVLDAYARKCRLLCTLEDHVVTGGFGSAVGEWLHENQLPVPLLTIGWPDRFVEHGKPEILRRIHGLTAEAVTARILSVLGMPENAENAENTDS